MGNKNKMPFVIERGDGRYAIVYQHKGQSVVSVLNFISRASAENWLVKYVSAIRNRVGVAVA